MMIKTQNKNFVNSEINEGSGYGGGYSSIHGNAPPLHPSRKCTLLYYHGAGSRSRAFLSITNYKPNYFTNEKQIF